MFAPNAASLGYALFLAVSAAGIWGGVFPFLPMEFQTREILLWFFLAQSLMFTFVYFASLAGSYFWPKTTRSFLVKSTGVPYFLGWCCLIVAPHAGEYALPLIVGGGVLLGVGSVGFYMLWQRLFAAKDADEGNRNLLVGSAYGALMYYGLHMMPQTVTTFLIPFVFLPAFSFAVILKSRELDLHQSMFEDVPRDHPRIYRQVILDHWRSALCVGAVGFCAGTMRSVAIADPTVGALVNMLSMAGLLIAAVILMIMWSFKNIRLDIVNAYKIVFPFLITSFLLLPFAGETYIQWLAAILYAAYSASVMLMMMQCAQVSRDRGINPVFIYAFFGTVVYTLQNVGFVGGIYAGDAIAAGLSPLTTIALIAVYALGLMRFVGSGGFRGTLDGASRTEHIELVAMTPSGGAAKTAGESGAAKKPGDRISRQATRLQEHYRLSARELEVMELLARGNSVPKIAEMLVVSENTIRTHSKRIYTKLDIHKKQELIDLINSF